MKIATYLENQFQILNNAALNEREYELVAHLEDLKNLAINRTSSDILKIYTETVIKIAFSCALGVRLYAQNNFDLAETTIVTGLKPILSNPNDQVLDPSIIEHLKLNVLTAMITLGKIYLNKNYFNNHAKAAAIFQYCAAFSEKYNLNNAAKSKAKITNLLLQKAYIVELKFLSTLNKINEPIDYLIEYDKTIKRYKQDLSYVRTVVKYKLDKLNELGITKITERAIEVEKLYTFYIKFFINHDPNSEEGFLQKLLKDCHKKLGGPPSGCEYSIIALGSLAFGTATPWSDIEFAILINDYSYKEYFKNLTKLLQITVINLGETHLRSLGVEALNNFKTGNPKDDWFRDNILKIKFNFDSARPEACKTPLGRQEGYKEIIGAYEENGLKEAIIEEKPSYELILTPKDMAKFQDSLVPDSAQETWFKSDMTLVQTLRTTLLIEGSQSLLDDYRAEILNKDRALLQRQALTALNIEVKKYKITFEEESEGKIVDCKQEIFRVIDRFIGGLANYLNITPQKGCPGVNAWQIVGYLEEQSILCKEGAQHLKEALSIAAELRLRVYSHNDSRQEATSLCAISTSYCNEQRKKELIEETFYIKDKDILEHFYLIITSVEKIAKVLWVFKEFKFGITNILFKISFYNADEYTKGLIATKFLKYDKAIFHLENAHKACPEDILILETLYSLYVKTSRVDKALKIAESLFDLTSDEDDFHNIILNCERLGDSYYSKGMHELAVFYYEKIIYEIKNNDFKDKNNEMLNNIYLTLSDVFLSRGMYQTAVGYTNKVLKSYLNQPSENVNPQSLIHAYNILSTLHFYNEEYDYVMQYSIKALAKCFEIFKDRPNHPYIAAAFNNIANVLSVKGQAAEAIKYYKLALEIYFNIYENFNEHEYIAEICNNLGLLYADLKEYDEAIYHITKGLEIYTVLYNYDVNRPNIASIYNNLGTIFVEKKEYSEAFIYFYKSKVIYLSLNEQGYKNPGIIDTYFNLASLYNKMGIYSEAEMCSEIILKLFNVDFNQLPANSVFNKNLYALSYAYFKQGKFLQAFFFGNKAYTRYFNDNNLEELEKLSKFLSSSANHFSDHEEIANKIGYVQFLLLNKYSNYNISEFLYTILNYDTNKKIQIYYSYLNSNFLLSEGIKRILKEHNDSLEINSKTLAYYLLLTHPEYISKESNIENLLNFFDAHCNLINDDISDALYAEVCDTYNVEMIS